MSNGGEVRHPFANSKSLLVVVPNDKVDLEEELELYNSITQDIVIDSDARRAGASSSNPRRSGEDTISIRSKPFSEYDIWLADNSMPDSQWGTLLAVNGPSSPSAFRAPFARLVTIDGWAVVGDMGRSPISNEKGGFVVYDCCITTRDGRKLHTHKRYSSFVQLHEQLSETLPPPLKRIIPSLPPKSPFSRYRPQFLLTRQKQLQEWLSQVLLHPDLGGTQVVKQWVLARA